VPGEAVGSAREDPGQEPARQESIRQAVMTVARCGAGRRERANHCAQESSFPRSGHRFAAAAASNAKHARAVLIPRNMETARAGKSGNCSSGKAGRPGRDPRAARDRAADRGCTGSCDGAEERGPARRNPWRVFI
jgi:hypothetical protein